MGVAPGTGSSGIGETMEIRQTEASEEIFEEVGLFVDHVNAWLINFIGGKQHHSQNGLHQSLYGGCTGVCWVVCVCSWVVL